VTSAAERLATLMGTGEQVEVDGRLVRGRVPLAGRAVPGLLRDLDRTGVELTSIEVRRPTLDDVFLDLTGRSLREG
jgi:ABC-2 type transport system ATP-binding protein